MNYHERCVRQHGALDALSLLIINVEEFLGPSGGVWKVVNIVILCSSTTTMLTSDVELHTVKWSVFPFKLQ